MFTIVKSSKLRELEQKIKNGEGFVDGLYTCLSQSWKSNKRLMEVLEDQGYSWEEMHKIMFDDPRVVKGNVIEVDFK